MKLPPWKRRWKGWMRTVHIYTSTFALLSTLFFSMTGFMLNHSDWFGIEETQVETREETFPAELLAGELDRLAIVEELRRSQGVTGLLSDFETEERTLRITFARPGQLTDATIDRGSGALELRVESGGVVRLLTELHKGEGSGAWGGMLIDVSSLSLLLISITGLVLWLILPKRRRLGLAAIVVGIGLFLCACVYCLL